MSWFRPRHVLSWSEELAQQQLYTGKKVEHRTCSWLSGCKLWTYIFHPPNPWIVSGLPSTHKSDWAKSVKADAYAVRLFYREGSSTTRAFWGLIPCNSHSLTSDHKYSRLLYAHIGYQEQAKWSFAKGQTMSFCMRVTPKPETDTEGHFLHQDCRVLINCQIPDARHTLNNSQLMISTNLGSLVKRGAHLEDGCGSPMSPVFGHAQWNILDVVQHCTYPTPKARDNPDKRVWQKLTLHGTNSIAWTTSREIDEILLFFCSRMDQNSP